MREKRPPFFSRITHHSSLIPMSKKSIKAYGVSPILPTPFSDDGAIDVSSLQRLIEYQKPLGVTGVSILGFMGENDKMSDADRKLVTETVVDVAGDDLDVWVGVRSLGTMGAVEASQRAEAAGADAVFVAPIPIQNDDALYHHFETVSDSVDIPVMIHDYPASHQVKLSAELIARIGRDGICPYIKQEDPPVGPKMTKVRELSGDSIKMFGGLGGFYFLEEMERGAVGIMTGFSFAEILVRVYDLYTSGQTEAAASTFNHYAGLIRYEFQPGIGLALRKHIYHKRGIFSSPHVRTPIGMALTNYDIMEYERVIARAGLTISGTGPQTLV